MEEREHFGVSDRLGKMLYAEGERSAEANGTNAGEVHVTVIGHVMTQKEKEALIAQFEEMDRAVYIIADQLLKIRQTALWIQLAIVGQCVGAVIGMLLARFW